VGDSEKKISPGAPTDAPAGGNQDAFLSRWSRLKDEARHAPAPPAPEKPADSKAPAPELPPLEKLTFDSDYSAFFHPKVDEDLRRAALKKLFSDPHFNVMDGLDVYIDDYSKTEPIPAAMMAGLRQAQNILQWAREDEEQRKLEETQQAAAATPAALDAPAAPAVASAEPPPNAPEAMPVSAPGAREPTAS
jgi:hypothetical protein